MHRIYAKAIGNSFINNTKFLAIWNLAEKKGYKVSFIKFFGFEGSLVRVKI